MDQELPPPDRALSRRVFASVEFERRLILSHQSPRGSVTITIYTLWEILGYLALPRPEIELEKISDWIEQAVGDPALAIALRRLAVRADDPEQVRERMKYLIGERLRQCREKGARS